MNARLRPLRFVKRTATVGAVPGTVAPAASDLRIDIDRLRTRLADLAAIGAIEGTEGCARLALTDEDKAGRDLVVTWMHDLGMDVTIDAIGVRAPAVSLTAVRENPPVTG